MTGSRPNQSRASVVYMLPYKMGGVFNYVDNLLRHRRPDGLAYHAILDNNLVGRDTRPEQPLAADSQMTFDYSLPPENLRTVLRRLVRALPKGPGAVVSNDWLSLAMSTVHDTGRTLISITHGDFDYYYQLAVMHEPVIDCFLTYTDRMRDRLVELLPWREESVVKIAYGVAVPPTGRQPTPGPLRLLYSGRLDRAKGIFDLPLIDAELTKAGVDVTWTIQGDGPDRSELQSTWKTARPVSWRGMQPMADVLHLYQTHDVLVMPCRSEGLPVALLEAAVAGVVPVVTNLPSGIPEVVTTGETGFRCGEGDVAEFAGAIVSLARDRQMLERLSASLRTHASTHFDVRQRAGEYQDLYARWPELRRPRRDRMTLHYGSRLDKSWIPNGLVKYLRRNIVPR